MGKQYKASVQGISNRVSAIKRNGGDYATALYNELTNTSLPLTEEDVWSIVDSVGNDMPVINAIICARVLDATAIFYILKSRNFKKVLCELAVVYYPDAHFLKMVLTEVKKREFTFFDSLLNFANSFNEIPFEEWLEIVLPQSLPDVEFLDIRYNA